MTSRFLVGYLSVLITDYIALFESYGSVFVDRMYSDSTYPTNLINFESPRYRFGVLVGFGALAVVPPPVILRTIIGLTG